MKEELNIKKHIPKSRECKKCGKKQNKHIKKLKNCIFINVPNVIMLNGIKKIKKI